MLFKRCFSAYKLFMKSETSGWLPNRALAWACGILFCGLLNCSFVSATEADPEMLKTVADDASEMQERDAAVKTLAKTHEGAMAMIAMAKKNEFPEEMRSSAALALAESDDADVRKVAAEVIPLPKMKDGTRIPPISKLVEMKGDINAGRAIFAARKVRTASIAISWKGSAGRSVRRFRRSARSRKRCCTNQSWRRARRFSTVMKRGRCGRKMAK